MVPVLIALFAAFRTELPVQNVLVGLNLAAGAGLVFQWAGFGSTLGGSGFLPASVYIQNLEWLFFPAVWTAQFFSGDALSRWIVSRTGSWKPSSPGIWRLIIISFLSLVLHGVLQFYAASRAGLEVENIAHPTPLWSAGSAAAWLAATVVTHVVLVPWMIDKTRPARSPDLLAAASWVLLASYFALRT